MTIGIAFASAMSRHSQALAAQPCPSRALGRSGQLLGHGAIGPRGITTNLYFFARAHLAHLERVELASLVRRLHKRR
jgi:hypothetical protein